MSRSVSIPTKREILKNIASEGRKSEMTDEERLQELIQAQYTSLQKQFAHAVINLQTNREPPFMQSLRTINAGLWHLCASIWKFRWVVGKVAFQHVSYGTTGMSVLISSILKLIDGYLYSTIGAVMMWRAYKKIRGDPKLSRREMILLKIVITCMEWLRKLYELPISFSIIIYKAVQGHAFRNDELDMLHQSKTDAAYADEKRKRSKDLNAVMHRSALL